jgi:nicotinamidase-related amidase
VTAPRWWQRLFEGEDAVGYRSLRHRQPPGERPALLVIDVVGCFVGPPGVDLAAAVRQWPTACGPAAHRALPAIARLLDRARRGGVPVVHTRPLGPPARLLGPAVKGELAGEFVGGRPGAVDFDPAARPDADELVLAKPRASAFFDTPLATYLRARRVDSLVVAGCTTSGCVRATVVDGFSHGFATFVVEQAVFDRSRLSAGVSLYEMDAKYADVLQIDTAVRWLATVGGGDGARAGGDDDRVGAAGPR